MSMSPFTVYQVATGNILRRGLCKVIDVERQAVNAGEAVLPVDSDDELDRVVIPSSGTPYVRDRGISAAMAVVEKEEARRAAIEAQMAALRAAAAN